MEYRPVLPPGRWRSPEDEAHWEEILESHDMIGQLYRQHLYLTMVDPRFAARMENASYRARMEREHKERCDRVDAAVRRHLQSSYLPDSGTWDPDFELLWEPTGDG